MKKLKLFMMETRDHFKNGVILSIASLMLFACGVTPSDYEEEIEDAVKYYISLAKTTADVMIEVEDWGFLGVEVIEEFNEMSNEVYSSWLTLHKPNAFEIILTKLLKHDDYGDYAETVLEYYHEIKILLSDYKKVKSSKKITIWSFKELNTGIEFTFEYNDDTSSYYISPLEHSIESYRLKLIESN